MQSNKSSIIYHKQQYKDWVNWAQSFFFYLFCKKLLQYVNIKTRSRKGNEKKNMHFFELSAKTFYISIVNKTEQEIQK